MKKILIIILAGVILMGIGIGVYAFLVQKKSSSGPSSPSFPSSGNAAPANGNGSQTLLQGVNGTSFETKDFLSDPTTVSDPVNSGTYYLGYHTFDGETQNVPYTIGYDAQTQSFTIVLLQEPLGQTRSDAETFLMEHLGITKDKMCALNYLVSVPNEINQIYAGKNLGFSFCPGAVALPN